MMDREQKQRRKDESIPWIPALIIVVVLIAGGYFWLYGSEEIELVEPQVTEKDLPDDLKIPEQEPEIKYPVPAPEPVPEPEPVSAEEEQVTETPVEEVTGIPEEQAVEEEMEETTEPEPVSTPTIQETLSGFLGQTFEQLFITESLVRHFVVTVDNMTTEKLPQRYSFFRHPAGKFPVIKEPDGSIFLDPANYDRYSAFVSLAESTNLQRLVDIYVRYYYLFQQAYEDLGYPNQYFNDRLVEVIDHVLVAPEVSGRISLEQPKVFYRFTNPKLQALSAGQKILVRMGPENATIVKERLRELRRLLTGAGNRQDN